MGVKDVDLGKVPQILIFHSVLVHAVLSHKDVVNNWGEDATLYSTAHSPILSYSVEIGSPVTAIPLLKVTRWDGPLRRRFLDLAKLFDLFLHIGLILLFLPILGNFLC